MKKRRIKEQQKLWRTEKLKGTESYEEEKNKRALKSYEEQNKKKYWELWRTKE